MHNKYLRRLPLENIYNARDLGGYLCGGSSTTKWKTFLRTDDLHHANNNDIEFLKKYGVKTVIDLRSTMELDQNPNPLATNEYFNYYNIPFNVTDLADATKKMFDIENLENIKNFLPNFYVDLLKNGKHIIKEIFEIIEKNDDGIILYHCTAGKDRTGVVSMLLLGLAGVSKSGIINNYTETYCYLSESPHIKKSLGNKSYPKEMAELLQSRPEFIQKALDYIFDNYDSVYSYLLSTGLDQNTLDNLIHRFTES